MQITDHVYQILGGMYANLDNVYVIRADSSLIMIDCAENEADMEVMREVLGRFELDGLPVSYLLLTHKHFGHIGNAALLQGTGTKIIAGRYDKEAIESGTPDEIMDFSPFPARDYTPCRVDIAVKDGEVLELDGIRITAYEIPGHTDGSVLYEYTENGKHIFFVGDVVQTAPDCKGALLGWEGAEDFSPEESLKTYVRLSRMPCDILLSGHMQACMQNGHLILADAVCQALLKYRKPAVLSE